MICKPCRDLADECVDYFSRVKEMTEAAVRVDAKYVELHHKKCIGKQGCFCQHRAPRHPATEAHV